MKCEYLGTCKKEAIFLITFDDGKVRKLTHVCATCVPSEIENGADERYRVDLIKNLGA